MKRIERLPGISSLLGKAYRFSGNSTRAADYLLKATESRPRSARAWESAARALDQINNDGAANAFRTANQYGTLSADSWYRFGRLLEESGDFSEAVSAYESAEIAGKPAGHMAFRIARCLAKSGSHMAAAIQFRRAAECGFDPRESYLALSSLQAKTAPKWVKLDLFREGQAHFLAIDDWTANHARLASEMNFSGDAVELYGQILSARSLKRDEVVNFALALEAEGQHDRARGLLGQAVRGLKNNERALGAGALFQGERRWSRARAEYLDRNRQVRNDSQIASRIALSFDREYRWSDAAEYFEKAFRLDPSDAHSAYKCGHALERVGQLENAQQWYSTALNLEPDNRHWWYRLGNVLSGLGRTEAAADALRRSLPTPARAGVPQSSGASIAVETGLSIRAATVGVVLTEQRVKQAAQDGSWVVHSPAGLIEMADAAIQLGLLEEANVFCASAIVHSLDLPVESRRHLSLLLETLGRPQESVEVLLDSRVVRTPDGVDLKIYLENSSARAERVYAECVAARPVNPKLVLFETNHGASAACHPLAIFREMTTDDRFSDSTFIWALNNAGGAPAELRTNPRVVFVRVGSDSYLAALASSAVLINNVSFPPYFARREGQRYLNTWHGTPMKTLGRSMKQGLVEYENLERNFLQASHLIAPNDLTKWALLDEHHLDGVFPGSFELLGSPRLDSLVNSGAILRRQIREDLKVGHDERLVLIAPTWRGGVSEQDLDRESLLEQLRAVANVPGTRVFYRSHRLTENMVAGLELPVEVVPGEIDTNDLLAAVDHLVSDYSSIVFDFLVTGRPITLFVPDINEYRDQRGLYVEPEELPVGVAHTVAELVAEIASGGLVDSQTYAAAAQKFGPREDGLASARCVDFLLSDQGKGAELNGRPSVIFHASLIPNGIASALLAALTELVEQELNVILLIEPAALRSQGDRAEVFRRIPEGVRLVSRVGGLAMTAEQIYIRGVVESGRATPGPDMLRRYEESWELEAKRITGDLPLSASIEWDGYAALWSGILSHLGQETTRRLIWQHNEMAEEESHKYPELANVFHMYPWFDLAVSVSDLLAHKNQSFIAERDLLPPEGVAAVRNALPFAEIRSKALHEIPDQVAQHFRARSPIVVTVGRMSMEKNQAALIEAWPTVRTAFPQATLIIVGSGPLEAHLVTQIRRAGLSDSVVLAGQIANPYPLMRAADLFVLPSLHEGQPVVLFEAMSLGVRVAASGCPGNIEAVRNGYGQIVPTEASGLASAIVDLLNGDQQDTVFDDVRHREESLRALLKAINGRAES